MDHYEITIIGAGLAGITAARRLKKQGRSNLLLTDKSKSVGGRLATRRVADGRADHGAQFFTVRTDELEEEVQGWLDQGWIKQWFGEKYPRYTAVQGMNGLAKQLASGLPTSLHTKVVKLLEVEGGYRLYSEDGKEWQSDKVLLTMPSPQITELLKNSEVEVEEEELKQLRGIYFEPTYVGIFHFKEETELPEDGHVDVGLPEGMERMVDHRKKGISDDTIVSVYMEADWSRKHYGEDYVMSLIKEKAAGYLNWKQLESEQLKRWRYAQAKKVMRQPYVDLSGDGRLVVAGDAFLRLNDEAGRTRFESAYLSGKDAAAYLSW
ncbi:FAD-dependent oxidoreductase [Halobacillus litoralis]|uniref:NAD(P)/FAD-dependent oxidoreductase n=1 Tax=Halobacillus litoralis TaxID=45668 RepID=UPI001CFD3DB8|nr:FAD-dependent oxidoreductase [Halobacillus litoralis]WLR48811.1 FAD-dependent oxidoreductase [Halobacillus litoralis]